MGAYTWTYIRIDKLSKEKQIQLAKEAKHSAMCTTYGSYCNKSWDKALKDWLDFHAEDYDYFVNECGVDPKYMTEEYLTEQLKEKMKYHHFKIECYDKCINGEMTLEDVLKETNQLDDDLHDLRCIKRDNHYYVQSESEIFRNYEYDNSEYNTVESLIEHCRNTGKSSFIDYAKDYDDYHEWNDEIEKHVRDFYEEIGDGNFYVHFG